MGNPVTLLADACEHRWQWINSTQQTCTLCDVLKVEKFRPRSYRSGSRFLYRKGTSEWL